MWVTVVLAGITCIIFLLKTLLSWFCQIRRLPPGPLPIPLYGNCVPKDIHPGLCKFYEQLHKKYGNIFTVYNGTKPVIVVNGYKAVNELLINNGSIVHTRPSGEGILSYLHDDAGLVWNNDGYKSIRKISSLALKSYISNSSSTETSSGDKLSDILDTLREESISDISTLLRDMVSENICTMIFGLDKQKKFAEVMSLHYGSLSGLSSIDKFMRLPLLKHVPGFRNIWQNGIDKKESFKAFLKQELNEHMSDFTTDKICEDFFDNFLRHNHTQKTTQLEELDCFSTVMQLMLAGLDAVHGTLMWIFLYITINPAVQNKMAEEIEAQIGLESLPTPKQMPMLPYCMAVIYETIRVSNVAFTSLPYTNQQQITIESTTIPANSSLIVNLVSVNKDPQTFPQPDKFIPERYIDKDGKPRTIPEFSPFSIGRRACLGELFSKSSLFVTVVRLLQRYQLRTVVGDEYSTQSIPSFLSTPAPYRLQFVARDETSEKID